MDGISCDRKICLNFLLLTRARLLTVWMTLRVRPSGCMSREIKVKLRQKLTDKLYALAAMISSSCLRYEYYKVVVCDWWTVVMGTERSVLWLVA